MGGYIKREISYQGDSLEEIARDIERDENSLLEYMQTGDTNGECSFCFGGFMFRKEGIIAAQFTEPDI